MVSCDVIGVLFVLFTDNGGQGSIQKWTITDMGSQKRRLRFPPKRSWVEGAVRAVSGHGALHKKGPRKY